MEVTAIAFCVLLTIADVFGILSNLSCLWYFIKSCNKGLYNHLIILLGLLDTIICSGHIGLVVPYHSEELTCESFTSINEDACSKPLKRLLLILPNSLYAFSGAIMGVLSVIRCLSIIFPFYMIRKIGVCSFLFIFSTFITLFSLFKSCDTDSLTYVGTISINFVLIVVVVALSGFPSIFILIKKSRQNIGSTGGGTKRRENIAIRNHRRASFTIFILTAVFIITNGIGIPLSVIPYITCSNERNSDIWVNYYSKISGALLLMNSICNPLVLIVRKIEIRVFLMAKVRKVMSLLI